MSIRNALVLPIVSAALLAATRRAGATVYTELDLRSSMNADIMTYTGGSNYQVGGSQLNVSGVPFSLALLANAPNTLGVIQTHVTQSISVPVPAATRATSVYVLMNSDWGEMGVNEGSIVVTGSLGETATLNLVVGTNIRDHYEGRFVNTLSDLTVVPTYFVAGSPNDSDGSVRLDRQILTLPASFDGDTIASISYNGIANGVEIGDPFLAAVTLEYVPEPATLASGLLTFGLLMMRRQRTK